MNQMSRAESCDLFFKNAFKNVIWGDIASKENWYLCIN